VAGALARARRARYASCNGNRRRRRRAARLALGALARQLLCQLGVHVAVVLLAAGHIFWLVALERVYVEDGAKAATVWARNALNANVKLATVGGVGVPGVVAGLVHLGGIWAHEAVANLGLVAPLHQVGPNANALLVVVGQAGRTLVLGGLAVPARVEDATVCVVGEEAVEARAVRR